MELLLVRHSKRETYTIGRLLIDGVRFCDTLEDKDRELVQGMSPAYIKSLKVYGETAIPKGRYRIDMDTVSGKYAGIEWYKTLCGGRLPRLVSVPGFEGILIHPGNTALDCLGCILVGENKEKGKVLNSRVTFARLYAVLKKAHESHEQIYITIQ